MTSQIHCITEPVPTIEQAARVVGIDPHDLSIECEYHSGIAAEPSTLTIDRKFEPRYFVYEQVNPAYHA